MHEPIRRAFGHLPSLAGQRQQQRVTALLCTGIDLPHR